MNLDTYWIDLTAWLKCWLIDLMHRKTQAWLSLHIFSWFLIGDMINLRANAETGDVSGSILGDCLLARSRSAPKQWSGSTSIQRIDGWFSVVQCVGCFQYLRTGWNVWIDDGFNDVFWRELSLSVYCLSRAILTSSGAVYWEQIGLCITLLGPLEADHSARWNIHARKFCMSITYCGARSWLLEPINLKTALILRSLNN